jgi:hypothetical protein
MTDRPRWSDRRRRTLAGLAAGAMVFGVGTLLPDELGVTALFLAALCAFLLVVALVVFVAVPGPGTLDTLLRSTPLAGASLVVAVLLLLSAPPGLQALWWAGVALAAAWAATALWRTRHQGE